MGELLTGDLVLGDAEEDDRSPPIASASRRRYGTNASATSSGPSLAARVAGTAATTWLAATTPRRVVTR